MCTAYHTSYSDRRRDNLKRLNIVTNAWRWADRTRLHCARRLTTGRLSSKRALTHMLAASMRRHALDATLKKEQQSTRQTLSSATPHRILALDRFDVYALHMLVHVGFLTELLLALRTLKLRRVHFGFMRAQFIIRVEVLIAFRTIACSETISNAKKTQQNSRPSCFFACRFNFCVVGKHFEHSLHLSNFDLFVSGSYSSSFVSELCATCTASPSSFLTPELCAVSITSTLFASTSTSLLVACSINAVMLRTCSHSFRFVSFLKIVIAQRCLTQPALKTAHVSHSLNHHCVSITNEIIQLIMCEK